MVHFIILASILLFFLINSSKKEKKPKKQIKNVKTHNVNRITEVAKKPKMENVETKNVPIYIKGKRKPLFVDVETTGLHSDDKIVSICMILLDAQESEEKQKLICKSLYYIFDPCKKSHPIAEGIHGYNDWVLRHQNLFEEKMHDILSLIKESDVIVAHNVKFDMKFIRNAFYNASIDIGEIDTMCTMEMHGGSLASCAGRLGIHRETSIHDASEDTMMCMFLYLKKMSNINILDAYNKINLPKLQNFITPPPVPEGNLPRRNNVKKRKEILGK